MCLKCPPSASMHASCCAYHWSTPIVLFNAVLNACVMKQTKYCNDVAVMCYEEEINKQIKAHETGAT